MSFHKNPKYQIPALVEALQAHGLEHDNPSQLADAFRTGWVAGRAAGVEPAVIQGQKPAFYANDDLARDFAKDGQGGMWVRTVKGGTHNTPFYAAPQPAAQPCVSKPPESETQAGLSLTGDTQAAQPAAAPEIAALRQVINNYYLALDKREHGGIAASEALRQIEQTLGMQWVQGAVISQAVRPI